MNQPIDDVEKAKEIVGKWGYEEPYWWEPIAQALTAARREAKMEVLEKVKNIIEELNDSNDAYEIQMNEYNFWEKFHVLEDALKSETLPGKEGEKT